MARICRDIQWKDVVLSKEFGPREVIGYNSEKLGMVVILNTSIYLGDFSLPLFRRLNNIAQALKYVII